MLTLFPVKMATIMAFRIRGGRRQLTATNSRGSPFIFTSPIHVDGCLLKSVLPAKILNSHLAEFVNCCGQSPDYSKSVHIDRVHNIIMANITLR